MRTFHLRQVGPLAFEVSDGHWTMRVDVPRELAGTDSGPMPTDLVSIALASCKAITGMMWAAKHGHHLKNLEAIVETHMAEEPHRIGSMSVTLHHVREQLPPSQVGAFCEATENCAVDRTFENPPLIKMKIV